MNTETYPGEAKYEELCAAFGFASDSFLLPKLFRFDGACWLPVL